MFTTLRQIDLMFKVTFNLSSANAFNLDKANILSSGKGLKRIYRLKIEYNVHEWASKPDKKAVWMDHYAY